MLKVLLIVTETSTIEEVTLLVWQEIAAIRSQDVWRIRLIRIATIYLKLYFVKIFLLTWSA